MANGGFQGMQGFLDPAFIAQFQNLPVGVGGTTPAEEIQFRQELQRLLSTPGVGTIAPARLNQLGSIAAAPANVSAQVGTGQAQPAVQAAQQPLGQQQLGLALAGLSALGALSQVGRRGPSAASSFDRGIRAQEQATTAQIAARGLGFNPQAVAASSAPLRARQAALVAAEEDRRRQEAIQAIGQLAALGLLLSNPGLAPVAPAVTSFVGQQGG